MGKTWEFENFEEAKLFFLNLMESFIEMNRYFVQNGDSPYYSCSLWDEKGGQEKMRDEAQERLELLSAIHDLGYESLRYSIFNEYGPSEWEVVIEYDDSKQVYNVYATMDRASFNKKLEFYNFENAKNKFLEKLDLTVEINKLFVENGEVPEYSSPLWDNETE